MGECLGKFVVLSGRANPELAQEIADRLGTPLGKIRVGRFSDGEIQVRIEETVRGAHAFVIQPTCHPVNENLMELLVIIDALRRASAKAITAVLPYYGYARQDRKAAPREPITAKLVANLLVTAGASRVVTVDLHAGQIQGFFDIPVDPLLGIPILSEYFLAKRDLGDVVVVSPDVGGVVRARSMAERLHASLAIVDKRRPSPNRCEVMNIIGDVAGKTAILVDDIVDTGGTFVSAALALKEAGAAKIYAAATHPVLSGPAKERIESSPIAELVVTNTIPIPAERRPSNLTVRSVAGLLAEAIKRIYEELSVSILFD